MYKNVVIHLGLIKDCGPSTVHKIIESVGLENAVSLYSHSVHDFMAYGLSESKAQLVVQGLANQKILEDELALIEKYGVTVVTRYCPEYSPLLAQIHLPPAVLYTQGDIRLLKESKAIACVGARKAHRYVSDALQQIVVPMIHQGWVVVSGGAAGADTFAHQVTLDQSGKTIVVVGTGLCVAYPSQNKKLFDAVVQNGGLMVSIFSMKQGVDPRCFPARNRIISGLSQGCIVFQAARKSGALITATQALDQGREVFAVPGSIFDPLSEGCHDLIKQGAKLTSNHHDVLSELEPSYQAPVAANARVDDAQGSTPKGERYASDSKAQKSILSGYAAGTIEQHIIDAVVVPMTSDALMHKFNIDLVHLQSILFSLSLEGHITQNSMGFWVRL